VTEIGSVFNGLGRIAKIHCLSQLENEKAHLDIEAGFFNNL
jgi:hypothetical protein